MDPPRQSAASLKLVRAQSVLRRQRGAVRSVALLAATHEVHDDPLERILAVKRRERREQRHAEAAAAAAEAVRAGLRFAVCRVHVQDRGTSTAQLWDGGSAVLVRLPPAYRIAALANEAAGGGSDVALLTMADALPATFGASEAIAQRGVSVPVHQYVPDHARAHWFFDGKDGRTRRRQVAAAAAKEKALVDDATKAAAPLQRRESVRMRSLDAKKKLGGDGTFEVQRSAIDAPALTMYACGLCLTGLRDAPTPAGVPLEAVHVKKGDVLRVVAAAADEASAAPPIYEGRCVSASASEFTFRLDDPRLDVAIDRGAAVFRVAAEGSWALAGLHLGHVDGHFTETDRWLHAARPIAPLVDSLAEYWVAERQRRISALRTRREIVKPIDYRRIAGIAGRAKLREFVSIRAAQRRVALEGPPQRAPPRTADGPQRRVVVPAHVKLASTPLPDIANDDEAAAFCAGALGKSTAVLLDVLDKYPADADVQVAGLRAMAGEISTRTGDADALAALGAEGAAAAATSALNGVGRQNRHVRHHALQCVALLTSQHRNCLLIDAADGREAVGHALAEIERNREVDPSSAQTITWALSAAANLGAHVNAAHVALKATHGVDERRLKQIRKSLDRASEKVVAESASRGLPPPEAIFTDIPLHTWQSTATEYGLRSDVLKRAKNKLSTFGVSRLILTKREEAEAEKKRKELERRAREAEREKTRAAQLKKRKELQEQAASRGAGQRDSRGRLLVAGKAKRRFKLAARASRMFAGPP